MKTEQRSAAPPLPAPQPAQILAEHKLDGGSGRGPDRIHGVTFDGTHVWFAGGSDNDLNCVDPASGKLVKKLGRKDCDAGLAFDGKNLWQVCGKRIHEIERAGGKTLRSFPVPEGCHASGLAFAAGFLWLGDFNGRAIHKLDPATGKVLRTIRSERHVTGVTWAGAELWHGTYPEENADVENEPGELRAIDPETGAVKKRVHLPAGTRISGTEFDGKDRIWLGSRQERDTLRAVRKP